MAAQAVGDICTVCGKEIRFRVYSRKDKVTQASRFLCGDCRLLPDVCFLCGFPVRNSATRLPDGRVICERDAATAVVDEQQGRAICEEVKESLDRQFARFIEFPQTNVTVAFMDRIRLQELFRIIGNDLECPNTLGCTETLTNKHQRTFTIRLLSGLPKPTLMTTCVHEYAHTWVNENVPTWRRRALGKDAVEGFCELMAYLFAEQQNLSTAKSNILANFYTLGQIDLFISAQEQFGLSDIVDWMKAGEDASLQANDLGRVRRVRNVSAEPTTSQRTATLREKKSKPVARLVLPDKLQLQGIVWSERHPTATINGVNLEVNQEAIIELRDGAVTVRCVGVQPQAVQLVTNNVPATLILGQR